MSDRANREYTVIGDVVNTASRREEFVDPDQIVISHATYERLQMPFEVRSLGVVPIRGRSGLVQILAID